MQDPHTAIWVQGTPLFRMHVCSSRWEPGALTPGHPRPPASGEIGQRLQRTPPAAFPEHRRELLSPPITDIAEDAAAAPGQTVPTARVSPAPATQGPGPALPSAKARVNHAI